MTAMNRCALLSLLLCATAVPAWGQSGQPDAPDPKSEQSRYYDRVLRGVDHRAMYEDVEVFRRILGRKLEQMYPAPANVQWLDTGIYLFPYRSARQQFLQPYTIGTPNNTIWGVPYGVNLNTTYDVTDINSMLLTQQLNQVADPLNARIVSAQLAVPQRPAFQLEGVYLKGQGVVFTTTLPHHGRGQMVKDPHAGGMASVANCAKCHAPSFTTQIEESFRTGEKMPSLWEQTRREVRGIKDEQKPPVSKKKELEVCGPGTVGEAVLKTLAENGHHFSHLAENESLTVVITFRGGEEPRSTKSAPSSAAEKRLATPNPVDRANLDPEKVRTGSQDPEKVGTASPTGQSPSANLSSARDYELLGDLHLKQGRFEDAVKAFQKAIDQKPDAKQMAAIYRKLAQVYLNLEKDAQAQEAVQKAVEWLKKQQQAAKTPQPAEPVPALPAKLIISARKKLLDQAGAGKISFEEFKKAATVEYLTFPPPAAKTTEKPRQ